MKQMLHSKYLNRDQIRAKICNFYSEKKNEARELTWNEILSSKVPLTRKGYNKMIDTFETRGSVVRKG